MPVKRGVADAARRAFSQRAALRYDGGSGAMRLGDVIELTPPVPLGAGAVGAVRLAARPAPRPSRDARGRPDDAQADLGAHRAERAAGRGTPTRSRARCSPVSRTPSSAGCRPSRASGSGASPGWARRPRTPALRACRRPTSGSCSSSTGWATWPCSATCATSTRPGSTVTWSSTSRRCWPMRTR